MGYLSSREDTMIEPAVIGELHEQVEKLLEQNKPDQAASIVRALHPADGAALLAALEAQSQALISRRLPTEILADVLEQMDEDTMNDVVQHLEMSTVARLLDEMAPDMAADLLQEMDDGRVDELLEQMVKSELVAPLLSYPEDSAGGTMNPLKPMLQRHATVQEAIAFLQRHFPGERDIYYLYTLDHEDRLVGVVDLRNLILARPDQTLDDIMDPGVMAVGADVDQEEVAHMLARYDLLALPVVDKERRLLGTVTVDDLMDVMADEATEDIQRLGGSEPLSHPYFSVTIPRMVRKRVGWLLLLFLGGTLTSQVMRYFEGELEQLLALATFIPLLIGTGGNAGSQSVSTIIRALAVNEVRFSDGLRVLMRELATGMLVGALLGIVGLGLALLWGAGPSLAIVVALSLPIVCTWANVVGSLVPLVADRLGIDAATVSAPMITTVVDATGLALYFIIAKLILNI
jgi:magnesium transporter